MNNFNAGFNALQWTVGPTSDDLLQVGLNLLLLVHCELMCEQVARRVQSIHRGTS
jgi:hypothetical protein